MLKWKVNFDKVFEIHRGCAWPMTECKSVSLTNFEKKGVGSGPMSMVSFKVYNYFNQVLFKLGFSF